VFASVVASLKGIGTGSHIVKINVAGLAVDDGKGNIENGD
jgi:hypothetical protein